MNDGTEIDLLNKEVTSAIVDANRKGYELIGAWERVLRAESQLHTAMSDGPERCLALEGKVRATNIVGTLKELLKSS